MDFVQFEELLFLVIGPRLLVDSRVEVVVPALSALFACALGDVVDVLEFKGELSPVIEAVLCH